MQVNTVSFLLVSPQLSNLLLGSSKYRKVQDRLEYHGIDYQAAAFAASIAEDTNSELMNAEKVWT